MRFIYYEILIDNIGNIMDLKQLLPDDWKQQLNNEFEQDYWKKLESFLTEEMANETVFPPKDDMFSAFSATPYEKVKVFIVGQDPYHDHNQAHGLCFSVRTGIKLPPSLRNIYKELETDMGIPFSTDGCLTAWAEQGILMLNTSLSVRAHEAASHSKKGWETFTDAVISKVNEKNEPVIFVLWGNHAAAKEKLIDASKHHIIMSAHPSPLSARRGFFGSRPFSKINSLLEQNGMQAIDWSTGTGKDQAKSELEQLSLF